MFDLNKLWYGISQGLMKIIDAINSVFYWLAGIRPTNIAPGSSYTPNINDNTILTTIFERPEINRIFLFFMGIGIGILGISTAIGLIKTSIGQKDQVASKKQMLVKSVSSLFWVIAMPVIFFACIYFVSVILNLIVYTMSTATGSSGDSLGTIIGKACMPDNITQDKIDQFNAMQTDYGALKLMGANEGFNYLMCILSSACVLVGLFMTCLTVVERLIHLVFLYLVSPFVLAKTPIDEGKSFEQWKELVISKFLGLAGIIICMYLFFLLMPVINEMFTYMGAGANDSAEQQTWHKFAFTVAKIVFIIAGVFTFTKAGTLFAHLVSASTGQFEGMSQMQSSALLGMGGILGAKILGKASQGARMAAGGGISALGGSRGAGGVAAMMGGGGGTAVAGGAAPMGMTGGAAAKVGGIPGISPLTGAAGDGSGGRNFGGQLRSGLANTGRVIAGAGVISGLAYGAGRAVANTLRLGGRAVKGIGKTVGKSSTYLPLVGKKGAGSGGVSLGERVKIIKSSVSNSPANVEKGATKAAEQQLKQGAFAAKREATLDTLAQKHQNVDQGMIDQMKESAKPAPANLGDMKNSVANALKADPKTTTNKDGDKK